MYDTSMRTTIILEDELARQAKRYAAEHDTTLTALVNEGLRQRISPAREDDARASFVIPVFGDPAAGVDTPPHALARLDEDTFR